MATRFAHFQHGAHKPEVVISRQTVHLAGPSKKLCQCSLTWQ